MKNNDTVRAALFSRSDDESVNIDKLYRMQQYCINNGYVITQQFYSEEDVLSCKEEFDIVVCCGETVLLPMTGVQFVDVSILG